MGPRAKDQKIGLTLRTRAAHLLAHDDSEQADTIYKDITDLYNMRSDLIHGNPHWTKDPQALFEERGYAHIFEKDRMHSLLDRWRDIVRRAITARLMLPIQNSVNRCGRSLAMNLRSTDAWCGRTDATSGMSGSSLAQPPMGCRCSRGPRLH